MSNNVYLRQLSRELNRPIDQLERIWNEAKCLVPPSTPLEKWFETSKAIFQNMLHLNPHITAEASVEVKKEPEVVATPAQAVEEVPVVAEPEIESVSGLSKEAFAALSKKAKKEYLDTYPNSIHHEYPNYKSDAKKAPPKKVSKTTKVKVPGSVPPIDPPIIPPEDLDNAVKSGPPANAEATPLTAEKKGIFRAMFSGAGYALKAVKNTVAESYKDTASSFKNVSEGTATDEDKEKVKNVTKNIMFGVLGAVAAVGIVMLAPTMLPLAASMYQSFKESKGSADTQSLASGDTGDDLDAYIQDVALFLSNLDPKELQNESDKLSELPA